MTGAERIHPRRASQHPDDRTRGAWRCRCRPRRGGCRGRRRFRDRFRRARLHRARGGLCSPCRRPHRGPGLHAGALHGSRRRCEDPGHRARAGADHPDGGRRRIWREARSVRSAFHRSRRLAARSSRSHGLFAPRIDHDDDQTPSGAHDREDRRDARRTSRGDGLLRRFQHRRLCLMGPDGRQPRAGARLRPLSHAALPGAGRARSTRISCPPAPFAASACRRVQSRKSNSTTSSRFA